jgi:RNA polymerase sigma-70 factor (ECF subfamily)
VDPNTILREIQNRNHFVFKKLFEDFYGELVQYAHGYLFDNGSSEDVVQEVFVRLWERSDGIQIKSTLKAYLYAMVRNRCLNHLKSVKITDTARILEFRTTFADTGQNFDASINEDRDKAGREVLQMVDALPAKMKAVVKLRFISNYRYTEIADELGISVNTVKTQLKRAKIKFGQLTMSILAFVSLFK